MKVHHVGYAVADIAKAISVFEKLGYIVKKDMVEDELRKIKIVFMKNNEECIELVAPNGEANPVEGVLSKNGSTPYHICYETTDMAEEILTLRKQGWIVIQKPKEAPAIDNQLVAFLYQKDIGMIELVEIKE